MRLPSLGNAILGLWLVVAPAVLGYGGVAATNDLVLGLTVLGVAIGSVMLLPRFTDSSWVSVCCGIWITLAPALLGYQELRRAATNDVAVGLLITIVAAVRVCTRTPISAR